MEHWDGVKTAKDEDDGGAGDRGKNSELVDCCICDGESPCGEGGLLVKDD